ncbi:histone-lysine N-methyltransferase SMYD3 [Galendromus occidentalis]|uniref:Histone-lysine N-methyltransferase SMYD3 n=1 Tax=Galendromus occidentalis TaxID=34638 RepID=A0AAJ7L4G0_9ACAR|nr:histone-lysine N-methyltransferase SMYD3 [Galendromus occidentalis]
MARIILRWRRELNNPSSETLLGTRRQLKDCMSHLQEIKRDRVRGGAFVEMLNLLKQFLTAAQLEGVSDLDILEIFGIMCVNTIHISNDDDSFGCALYLAPSLIDHSCYPNLTATFKGQKIVLKVLRPCEPKTVADLSLAYMPVCTTKERRRKTLREEYYFTCECEMCSGKVPEVLSEADPKLTDEVLELEKLSLDLSSPENHRKALKGVEELLSTKLKDLDDSDVAKFRAILVAADASVCASSYDRAYNYYSRSLPVMKRVFTENKAEYAYKLVRLARLSTIVVKTSQDPEVFGPLIALLQEAVRVTRIALGEDHSDTKDVALLYEELRAWWWLRQRAERQSAGGDE